MDRTASLRIEAHLAELWQRNLPVLHSRLDLLDRAASASANASLTQNDLEAARDIAHKLAGSLGTFGYQQGTDIARKLELLLLEIPPPSPDRFTPLTVALRKSIFPTS
jgi:chemotaxis protein histidine kinase CheA